MHQEADLLLKRILHERKPDTPIAELAKALRVSQATISHYLGERWTSIDRGLLERLADYLKCSVEEMFETRPSPFFDTFIRSGSTCRYLHFWDKQKPGGFRDDRARDEVSKLVHECSPHTEVYETLAETGKEFFDYADENRVVVGSPRINPAAEYALAEVFKSDSFASGTQVALPPFQFVWHSSMKPPASTFGRLAAPNEPCGIWLRDQDSTVVADYVADRHEFLAKRIRDGRDCAVVVVVNHPGPISGLPNKLVILAGLRGIGTEAAALRLAFDYRELEPRAEDQYVWGILEVVYKKEPGQPNGSISHSAWRYRAGGRLPMNFKTSPILVPGGVRKRKKDSTPSALRSPGKP